MIVSPCLDARPCPALLVTAPASGQGKTTVTAALAHWHRSQGRRVRVFKTGPDFLDPMVLECASGAPVQQLDLWMGGAAHCAGLLHSAAAQADLILVEGVMGLHDGTPSSADLALHFGLPVLVVIDASAMAQTFGAVAHGLATYRPGLRLTGVLANRVGSAGHAQMLHESLPAGIAWYGALPRGEHYALPSRHLGLVQAGEVGDMAQRIAAAAQALGDSGALPMPPAVDFDAPPTSASAAPPSTLAGVTIAIARDAAFSFLYRSNLDALRALGAELCFFSPLANQPVPAAAHALYLPGGYPELHLPGLAGNTASRESICAHHAAGRPLVAECGGMLALLESLTDAAGHSAPMLGLLPGQGVMADRLVNLGMHSLALPEGEVRGHTFHHARIDVRLPAALHTQAQRHHGQPEPVYRKGRLFASFMHLYFPSNPAAVAALFKP
jgi:cobyrinic acid a,c-diamide synthase